jgi:hypothetical protein
MTWLKGVRHNLKVYNPSYLSIRPKSFNTKIMPGCLATISTCFSLAGARGHLMLWQAITADLYKHNFSGQL